MFDSIVFLSPFGWDGVWQTPHHLARHFAGRCPVLYVEPAMPWNPRQSDFRLKPLLAKGMRHSFRRVEPDLYVLRPWSYPLGRWRRIREANDRSHTRSVLTCCKELGLKSPLLWVFYYEGCLRHAKSLNFGACVYHCIDYFDSEEERELSRRADLVFSVNPPLARDHKAHNSHGYFLPNGVESSWFKEASSTRPPDLPPNGHLIGFVGLITRHHDLALLVQVARTFQEASLVLVGPVGEGPSGPQGEHALALQRLRSMPNVRFVGQRDPLELPPLVSGFDVCLIPLLQTPFNLYRDPLKFYQYLAMGKPVVTTPLPVAERYEGLCYVARTHEEFIHKICCALDESDKERRRQARIEIAGKHRWESIVAQAWRQVEEFCETRAALAAERVG